LGEFGGFSSQKEAISAFLKNKPEVSAELFLKSLKNAAAVKSELAVFQKLYDPSPTLKFGNHEIHRVILNVANYFFQDFADQQIRLVIESSNVKLRLDYESMQVALYHILDNAAKYSLASSEVRVTFKDDGDFIVCFEMTSLAVAGHERAKVLLDGFSGDQAKSASKAGQGLGMSLIADLLRLNNAALEAIWGEPLQLASNMPASSPRYAHNRLSIRFHK
jgi:K+-sensing histidine kinase KdpD